MSVVQEEKKDFKETFGVPKVICAMGGPCSGKGKFAKMMAEELGYTYISTGEILRNEITKVSKFWQFDR